MSETSKRPRSAWAGFLLSVVLLLVGSAQLAPGQDPAEPTGPPRVVIKGSHMRMVFGKDVRRVAVGDEQVMGHEPLSSREILLLGKAVGRTSLIVWFSDDTLEHLVFSVERDLETLRAALRDIHPDIIAEIAPDRDAVVLRGIVPTMSYKAAAEAAARAYVTAVERNRPPQVNPMVSSGAAGAGEEGAPAESGNDLVRGPEEELIAGAVINLIRVEELPLQKEDQIRLLVDELGGDDVTIQRVVRGDLPDDEADLFVLAGTVDNQIDLIRVLSASARVLFGDEEVADEIKVIADESGGRISVEETGLSATQGAVDDLLTAVLKASTGGSFGSSGASSSSGLFNLVGNNLARAKAIQLGDGRLLSFIEVDDLPQVRVDIRLYEINRARLLEYTPRFGIVNANDEAAQLLPASSAVALQGGNAVSVGAPGGADIQNVLSFLAGGFTNQLQISDSKIAIDIAFSILETEGIAKNLARPSITVLSGELAAVQVGGTIPVQTAFAPAFGGSAEVIAPGVFSSVETLDFGISLAVRPMVGDDGTITLDVVPRTLFPDPNLTVAIRESSGTQLPTTAFEGKSLRTTARLNDGQGMMIGGLVSRTRTEGASFTPWLHDIPGLGWLFKRFNTTDQERDLIVVVNPIVLRDLKPEVSLWEFESRAAMLPGLPGFDPLQEPQADPVEASVSSVEGETSEPK